jgi:hypothetical protein
MPVLQAAERALRALNKNDIIEIKTFTQPPALVQLTMEGVCLLLREKPDWDTAKKVRPSCSIHGATSWSLFPTRLAAAPRRLDLSAWHVTLCRCWKLHDPTSHCSIQVGCVWDSIHTASSQLMVL